MTTKYNDNLFTGGDSVDSLADFIDFLNDTEEEDETYDPTCYSCGGSGEDKYGDGSCYTCKGKGVLKNRRNW